MTLIVGRVVIVLIIVYSFLITRKGGGRIGCYEVWGRWGFSRFFPVNHWWVRLSHYPQRVMRLTHLAVGAVTIPTNADTVIVGSWGRVYLIPPRKANSRVAQQSCIGKGIERWYEQMPPQVKINALIYARCGLTAYPSAKRRGVFCSVNILEVFWHNWV